MAAVGHVFNLKTQQASAAPRRQVSAATTVHLTKLKLVNAKTSPPTSTATWTRNVKNLSHKIIWSTFGISLNANETSSTICFFFFL